MEDRYQELGRKYLIESATRRRREGKEQSFKKNKHRIKENSFVNEEGKKD